ncbi:MAG: hypothetical protein FJY19_04405 [Bacteroidetes bacterium]|nr:hypothetical protein [Bacteroidota bacterium]
MQTSSSRFLTTAVMLLLLINTGLVIYLVLDKNKSHRSYNRERPDIAALFAKEVDLSVEQAQHHRILHEAHFKRVGALHDSIRLVKIALFTAATTSTADSLLLLSNQKINNWQIAINAQTVSYMQKVKDMLTDQQKKKYDQFIIKMMQRGHRDSNRGH